jgi:hypothetical protein
VSHIGLAAVALYTSVEVANRPRSIRERERERERKKERERAREIAATSWCDGQLAKKKYKSHLEVSVQQRVPDRLRVARCPSLARYTVPGCVAGNLCIFNKFSLRKVI